MSQATMASLALIVLHFNEWQTFSTANAHMHAHTHAHTHARTQANSASMQ